jgi:hypothetical protein
MCSWSIKALTARVADAGGYRRYEAASPDHAEVECYSSCLPPAAELGIVLGMTPEVRNMAARRCRKLISIDKSPVAIDLYRDWLDPTFRQVEEVVSGDWFDLQRIAPGKAGFILGDGIFGNIAPINRYAQLLAIIRDQLAPDGVFVTRQCLMPERLEVSRDSLTAQFRRAEIDESGFSLGMRVFGYINSAYDASRFLLDNARVFALLDADYQAGVISTEEYRIVRRYFFDGENTIPSRAVWEQLLTDAGFAKTKLLRPRELTPAA